MSSAPFFLETSKHMRMCSSKPDVHNVISWIYHQKLCLDDMFHVFTIIHIASVHCFTYLLLKALSTHCYMNLPSKTLFQWIVSSIYHQRHCRTELLQIFAIAVHCFTYLPWSALSPNWNAFATDMQSEYDFFHSSNVSTQNSQNV